MKKIFALLLAAAMLLSLAACGGEAETETEPAEAPAEEELPEGLESAELPDEDYEAQMEAARKEAEAAFERAQATLAEKLEAYPADALVMTVNGQEITWDLYYYWIADTLLQLGSRMGALPEDYSIAAGTDEEGGELTLDEMIRRSCEGYIRFYASAAAEAERRGVELSPEREEEIEASRAANVEHYGGEEGYREALAKNGMTEHSFFYYARCGQLGLALMEESYGAQGEKVTAEMAGNWAEEQEKVRAKHILLSNETPAGEAELSEEERAARHEERQAALRAELEAIRAELAALSGDREALEARFDELMAEHSQDPGLAAYPDGYFFGRGEMVKPFEDAAFALGDYELSPVVDTDYGVHLLLRLPMEPDAVAMMQGESAVLLRQQLGRELFAKDNGRWAEAAELQYSPEFENFSLTELFS